MKKQELLVLMLCLKCFAVFAQIKPLENAHAHNDYEHTRPLKDALSYRFTSVEADIYLIDNELYVSHNYPKDLKNISLKQLYLDPLQQILKRNHNKIYPGFEGTFYLLIDFKSDASPTYKRLNELIGKYPEFINNPNFKIYLSGKDLLYTLKTAGRIMCVDGRPKDIHGNYTNDEMPVISESFSTITGWKGQDQVTDEQWKLAESFIYAVHKAGKKCRLWAIPDNEIAWQKLLNYHIDFINTDKLKELSDFLTKK